MIEVLLAGGLAGAATWVVRRRRLARQDAKRREVFEQFDADARAALEVAIREAHARGGAVTPAQLLWGLLQAEPFAVAIEAIGGSPPAIEKRVLEELDHPTLAPQDFSSGIAQVVGAAHHNKRLATCTAVWLVVARTNAGALVEVSPVRCHALSFWMVHGCREPAIAPADTEQTVVLRNDDYSTLEFVQLMLREVFSFHADAAARLAREVTDHGRGTVGRYPGPEAGAKVEQARALARRDGFPLWIAIEPR